MTYADDDRPFENKLPEDALPIRETGSWQILFSQTENSLYIRTTDYHPAPLKFTECQILDIITDLHNPAYLDDLKLQLKTEENRLIKKTVKLKGSAMKPERAVQSISTPPIEGETLGEILYITETSEKVCQEDDDRNTLLEYIVLPSIMEAVPFSIAEQFLIFAHRTNFDTLRIVVDRDYDERILNLLKFLTGYGEISIIYKTKSQILEAIHYHYPKELQAKKHVPDSDPLSLITEKSILLVDNNYNWRGMLKDLMQTKFPGYRVITCGSGRVAIDLIRKYPERIAMLIVAGYIGDMAVRDIFRTAKTFVSNLPCIAYGALNSDVDLPDTCMPSAYDTDALFEAISAKLHLDGLPQKTGGNGNAD
jgi:NifU-like protein involved in Fe-S cluster formation